LGRRIIIKTGALLWFLNKGINAPDSYRAFIGKLAFIAMKRKILFGTSIIVFGSLCFFGYRYFSLPNLDYIENRIQHDPSEVAEKQNYQNQIQNDLDSSRTFLLELVEYCEVYNMNFPFDREAIKRSETDKLLEIFNDSSSYQWGEYTTPEYDKTVVFYGDSGGEFGYLLLDTEGGATRAYPYRSVMKWGVLRNLQEVLNLLNLSENAS
jgi:hypothetical protein